MSQNNEMGGVNNTQIISEREGEKDDKTIMKRAFLQQMVETG